MLLRSQTSTAPWLVTPNTRLLSMSHALASVTGSHAHAQPHHERPVTIPAVLPNVYSGAKRITGWHAVVSSRTSNVTTNRHIGRQLCMHSHGLGLRHRVHRHGGARVPNGQHTDPTEVLHL